jgi:hypothetical protein
MINVTFKLWYKGQRQFHLKNVALVARRDADGRSNLELPLSTKSSISNRPELVQKKKASVQLCTIKWLNRHDFPVDPTDVDAGVDAGLVVRVDDVPAVDFVCSDGAVARSLPYNFRTHTNLPKFIYIYQV